MSDLGTAALELAALNWAVGPLCHCDRKTRRMIGPHGKDPVGRLVPHGVLDFTTDPTTIAAWWHRSDWNIGARIPESMFMLDADDLDALAALEAEHGALPETLTTISGRVGGGRHFYFRRPAGKISQRRLPKGIEIKTHTGYAVQPPSIHPHSGNVYTRIDAPVADPPRWLVKLLRPAPPRPAPVAVMPPQCRAVGPSIADEFTGSATWAQILMPHQWVCVSDDTEGDGARWLHPAATSSCSATIRNGCLFVYSPNTPFEVTEPGSPKGYTKFRAYAVLNHLGDLKAAARALREDAK